LAFPRREADVRGASSCFKAPAFLVKVTAFAGKVAALPGALPNAGIIRYPKKGAWHARRLCVTWQSFIAFNKNMHCLRLCLE
jgi:hypothetical protein